VVVGAGPNGLSAAVEIARNGRSVLVVEAKDTIGGGARTSELTLPGFLHDVCSAIHPVGVVSPFFASLDLEKWGVEWAYPRVDLAHPFDDGTAAVLLKDLKATCDLLGPDGPSYERMMGPLVARASDLFPNLLAPIRIPRHPFLMAHFGMLGLRSCTSLARSRFSTAKARALFAGCCAHSILPLEQAGTASFGIVLALAAHAVGWPCARGGSRTIVDALARCLAHHGGEIRTNAEVRSLADLPPSRVVLFDLTAGQVAKIADDALPAGYRDRLAKFRYGPGVFKVDWALEGPIPWRAAECREATTVHVGGTIEEVVAAEAAMGRGEHPERPFVLVAQQSLVDATRAPEGKHTGWAYCHVPNGSSVDMTARIEAQIERFAPGFRDLILERRTMGASQYEAYNANFVGGDIGGGANNLAQFLAGPGARWETN
jgi:phytoene dehydrogenase-like protein